MERLQTISRAITRYDIVVDELVNSITKIIHLSHQVPIHRTRHNAAENFSDEEQPYHHIDCLFLLERVFCIIVHTHNGIEERHFDEQMVESIETFLCNQRLVTCHRPLVFRNHICDDMASWTLSTLDHHALNTVEFPASGTAYRCHEDCERSPSHMTVMPGCDIPVGTPRSLSQVSAEFERYITQQHNTASCSTHDNLYAYDHTKVDDDDSNSSGNYNLLFMRGIIEKLYAILDAERDSMTDGWFGLSNSSETLQYSNERQEGLAGMQVWDFLNFYDNRESEIDRAAAASMTPGESTELKRGFMATRTLLLRLGRQSRKRLVSVDLTDARETCGFCLDEIIIPTNVDLNNANVPVPFLLCPASTSKRHCFHIACMQQFLSIDRHNHVCSFCRQNILV